MGDWDEVSGMVDKYAAVIGLSAVALPTYDHGDGTGRPHVERDGDQYAWVVQEAGQELERRTTADLDELLFWIFRAAARSAVSRSDAVGVEPRIAADAELLTRLGVLEPRWQVRELATVLRALRERPHPNLRSRPRTVNRYPVRLDLTPAQAIMVGRIEAALQARQELGPIQQRFLTCLTIEAELVARHYSADLARALAFGPVDPAEVYDTDIPPDS